MIGTKMLWFSFGFASAAAAAVSLFLLKDHWIDRQSLFSQMKEKVDAIDTKLSNLEPVSIKISSSSLLGLRQFLCKISVEIICVKEDEEPINPSITRACVPEPWRFLSVVSSSVLKRVKEEFGVGDKGLVCLGEFRNVRAVFDWQGLKLELDETHYDFGTSYEIECESSDPERAKKLLIPFPLFA
ncbi:hypothetical protein U1Q18_024969 [Sarracenia purpurea var. burkii]